MLIGNVQEDLTPESMKEVIRTIKAGIISADIMFMSKWLDVLKSCFALVLAFLQARNTRLDLRHPVLVAWDHKERLLFLKNRQSLSLET